MTLNLHIPQNSEFKPRITVFGVGGAGGNAVNNMISSGLQGVNFVVANTDAQAIEHSLCEQRIQLGGTVTRGLGAGASPDVGSAAAEESMSEILDHLNDSNMVFITAGMGGGTGTGAAPVIAKAAREQGVLTVGVVTKPFHFEGSHRMKVAELGLEELQRHVDTLIIIPNQNLFRIANEKTTFADAFTMADNVLHAGVRGVTDLIIMPGLINLDFADIRTVMSEMGKAMMGTGEAEGEGRALQAAEAAISNPLLDNVSMKGARGVLINITGGMDMTLFEVDEAANRIREEVEVEANIIFGSTFNPDMQGKLRVSVIATGIESESFVNTRKLYGQQKISETATILDRQQPKAKQPVFEPEVQEEDGLMESALAEENYTPAQAIKEETAFIPPRPAQPANYPIGERAEFGGSLPGGRKEDKSKRSGLGLFGMMARNLTGSQEPSAPQNQQRPLVEPKASPVQESAFNDILKEEPRVIETVGAEAPKDDLFDIPAFLRKKT